MPSALIMQGKGCMPMTSVILYQGDVEMKRSTECMFHACFLLPLLQMPWARPRRALPVVQRPDKVTWGIAICCFLVPRCDSSVIARVTLGTSTQMARSYNCSGDCAPLSRTRIRYQMHSHRRPGGGRSARQAPSASTACARRPPTRCGTRGE
jgi:hypothetical protein